MWHWFREEPTTIRVFLVLLVAAMCSGGATVLALLATHSL